MRRPATWLLTRTGQEISGCYPYQWWTTTDGQCRRARQLHRPEAQARDRLQCQLGRGARDPVANPAREDCFRAVQKIIDDELAGSAKP